MQEEYTGTKLDRKEWNKLFNSVRTGDTIIFDSVSRMSHNAAEGVEAYEALYKSRVSQRATYRQTLQNSVHLTGGDVDYILEGVNRAPKGFRRQFGWHADDEARGVGKEHVL